MIEKASSGAQRRLNFALGKKGCEEKIDAPVSAQSRGGLDAGGGITPQDDAVEEALGGGGVPDLFVLLRHGHLRRQDERACLVAILADFPEVAPLGFDERGHVRVVDHQGHRSYSSVGVSCADCHRRGPARSRETTRRRDYRATSNHRDRLFGRARRPSNSCPHRRGRRRRSSRVWPPRMILRETGPSTIPSKSVLVAGW